MHKIDIETQNIDDKIQVFNVQYSVMETTPLLGRDYTVVDYGTINNNFIVENQPFNHTGMLISRKGKLYMAITIGSLILSMIGIFLLASKRVEGFFILILSILNAILSRKIVRIFC